MREFAQRLESGDIAEAVKIRDELLARPDEALRLEMMEVVRQAIFSLLKKGEVAKVKELKELFPFSQDALDETVRQAVLSSFYDGDIEKVKKIKDELPVARELGKKIIEYGASWGEHDNTLELQTVFA